MLPEEEVTLNITSSPKESSPDHLGPRDSPRVGPSPQESVDSVLPVAEEPCDANGFHVISAAPASRTRL